MEQSYIYNGNEGVGAYIEDRLANLGWQRMDDAVDSAVSFTYFTSLAALEEAYFGEGGVMQAMEPGSLVIDLSPATVAFSREAAALASVSGLHYLEAPIVFTDAAYALDGPQHLRIIAAGEHECLEEARPILDAIAKSCDYRGGAGAAALEKAQATIASAASLVASVEAASLEASVRDSAADYGWASVAVGGAQEDVETPTAAAYQGAYTVEMMMGEVAAALSIAEDAEITLLQLDSAMRLLELLAMVGGLDMSPNAIELLYRSEQAGAAAGLDWGRVRGLAGEGDADQVGFPDDDLWTDDEDFWDDEDEA